MSATQKKNWAEPHSPLFPAIADQGEPFPEEEDGRTQLGSAPEQTAAPCMVPRAFICTP